MKIKEYVFQFKHSKINLKDSKRAFVGTCLSMKYSEIQ